MAANTLPNTKAEVFGALVQKELKETASLVALVEDNSAMAVNGVSSISIPKLTGFTVQDRADGAAATENAALVDSVDTIALSKKKIVLWGYDEFDAMQSSIDYQMRAAERASSAHGRQINTDIVATWETVAGLNINGAVPADVSADDILSMRQFLIQNFADMTKTYFVIAADQEKAMLLLPEFSRYEYRGGVAPIISGQIGSVYGVPVIVNQFVKAQQCFMVEKTGSSIAFQSAPKYAETPALKYGTGGKEAAVDCLYGVGGLQLGEGLLLDNTTGMGATVSPLIAKLIN